MPPASAALCEWGCELISRTTALTQDTLCPQWEVEWTVVPSLWDTRRCDNLCVAHFAPISAEVSSARRGLMRGVTTINGH
jgi:hypothetical protein